MALSNMADISSAIENLIDSKVKIAIENLIDSKVKIASEKAAEKKPVCPICLENPFCPVCINILHERDGMKWYAKCQATLRNPCCLTCVRAHFITKINDGSDLVCPYRCCVSKKPSNNQVFLLYGEPARGPNDPADIYTWSLLDTYGVLNRVCPRCNIECTDLESVINHNKKDCPERLIPCKKCKVLVKFKDIDNHIEEKGHEHSFMIF